MGRFHEHVVVVLNVVPENNQETIQLFPILKNAVDFNLGR